MELRDYIHALRKGWKIIPTVALLVLAITAAITFLSPKSYQSNVQFFVSTADSSNTSQLAQGNNFLTQRVKSYAELLKAPIVLKPVTEDLGLSMSAEALSSHVETSIPTDSVLIDVTVSYSNPRDAQSIAAAIGRRFPEAIADLETVSSSGQSPVKVTMTTDPTLQLTPVSPKPVRYLGIGLAVGLILGLIGAVVRYLLDTKLRTKDNIEAISPDLTVIGGIPFDANARKEPVLLHSDRHPARAEAFRSLRTNLRFVDVANHPRTIVMTSTLPGEGKTTTTANLGLVLAETGASVVLVEGDLRRPRLLEYLGMEGAVGLTDVLIGTADLDEVLQPYGENSVVVLGAGQIPPNPSELLGSAAMSNLLKDLAGRYDYVLVDAPPLLPVTDAAVASTLVGGVIVVAGSGLVTREHFRQAIESLRAVNARILGVVLNRIPREGRSGYYPYHYGYGPTAGSSRRGSTSRRDAAEVTPIPNWEIPDANASPTVTGAAEPAANDRGRDGAPSDSGSLLQARRAAGDADTSVTARR